VEELRANVAVLTRMWQALDLQGAASQPPTPDQISAANAAFKYQLLSALMGAGSLDRITVTVTRDNANGLTVAGPGGLLQAGTHLAFVADSKPVEFELVNKAIAESRLADARVNVSSPLESFVLRDGHDGVIVAVAASLPAAGRA
jgi:hypothetical protein